MRLKFFSLAFALLQTVNLISVEEIESDASIFSFETSINVGNFPNAVAFSGSPLLAVTSNYNNSVSFYNAKTFELYQTLPTGAQPAGLAFNQSGNLLGVTNYGGNSLSTYIVSPDGIELSQTLYCGASPRSIAFSPTFENPFLTSFAAVVNQGGKTLSIYKVNQELQLQLVQTVSTNPEIPLSVAFSEDLKIAAVTNGGGSVSVYSLDISAAQPFTLLQTIPTGGTIPWNIAIHPSNKLAAVTNTGGTISIFNVDTSSKQPFSLNQQISSVVSQPRCVAFDYTGKFAAVVGNLNQDLTIAVYGIGNKENPFNLVQTIEGTGATSIAFWNGMPFAAVAYPWNDLVSIYQVNYNGEEK